MFSGICRVAVQNGLADLAWIGVQDSNGTMVSPHYNYSANSGVDVETILNQPIVKNLTALAWINRHLTHANDIALEQRSMLQGALDSPHSSIACFPVFRGEQIYALLTLYTNQPLLFVQSNLDYLNTLSNDISLALDGIDNQEKLIKSESRFTNLFQENIEACFILEGTDFIDANKAALKLLGLENLEQIKGKSPLDFSPRYQVRGELSVNKLTDLYRNILEKGAQHFEWRYIKADKQLVVTEIFATIVDYPSRKLVHAVCRDITKSKKNAEQLNQYEAILQSSNDAIISKNLEGTVLSWNRGAEIMFGYTEQDMLGQPINKLLNNEQLKEERLIDQKIVAGETVNYYETVHHAKNGQEINVSISFSPIINDYGEIIGISKIARNITEQKRIEKELTAYRENLEVLVKNRTQALEATNQLLKDSEERFVFALEATNAGLWDWDMMTNKTNCSPDYFKLLGYHPDDLSQDADSLWINLLHPDLRKASIVSVNEQLLRDGKFENEFQMRHKSGEYRWILSRGKVIERDQNGLPTRAIGIHTDITQRKMMEMALVNAKEIADQANSAKSNFVANMSHEIRTPMNAVIGFCYILRISKLDEQTKQIVNKIEKASHSLLAIINDILDFSKIESGHLEIVKESFSMADLLDSVSSIMMALAKNKPLERHPSFTGLHFMQFLAL